MHTRNLILSNNIYDQVLVNKHFVNQTVDSTPSDEEPVLKDDLIDAPEVYASTDVRYKKVSDQPRKNMLHNLRKEKEQKEVGRIQVSKVVNCVTLMYNLLFLNITGKWICSVSWRFTVCYKHEDHCQGEEGFIWGEYCN